ncbi:hypothetical protein NFC81_12850 [Salinispirillum sp. LH 10-3-1]|uniref:Insulinase family protein n=1 Tax=Salinispirillum sp. LH 10-3-1 TaxID=2952525 RepID=A0AB38YDZ6_9GAMM
MNGLLILVVLGILVGAGSWWVKSRPAAPALIALQQEVVRLDNGLEVHLVADPDAAQARLELYWEVGSLSDPADLPGLHDLMLRVLFYGETPQGYRHMETRAARDPLGDFVVQHGRTHSRIQLDTSPSVFTDEVRYLARLLQLPSLPLPAIDYERQRMPRLDPAYDFFGSAELRVLDELSAERSAYATNLMRDLDNWRSLSEEGVARQLSQRIAEKLHTGVLRVSLHAPLPADALRELADAFAGLRSGTALPDHQLIYSPLVDVLQEPQVVRVRRAGLSNEMHILYPWRLRVEQREKADDAVRWLTSPYASGLKRRLREAGLITGISAHYNDEYFVVSLQTTAQGRSNEAVLYGSVSRFLAQIQNGPEASELVRRVAGDRRIAPELAIAGLGLDPSLFVVMEMAPGAGNLNWRREAVVQGYAQRALPVELPVLAPTYTSDRPRFEANEYSLLGWQPDLLLSSPGLTFWHYEDNRYDTDLVSAHVRVNVPIGPDPARQAQWQAWAMEEPAWWNETAVWSAMSSRSLGSGLQVSADATGVTWQFTDSWPAVEQWTYDFLASLWGMQPQLPTLTDTANAAQRLVRQRAQWPELAVPEDMMQQPLTVLLSGRVDRSRASTLLTWLRAARQDVVVPVNTVNPASPLPTRHHVAELEVSGATSSVTRFLQLPHNDLRHQVLAEWSTPWVEEVLQQVAQRQGFAGEVSVELVNPTGIPALQVTLSSSVQDPARLGLYLTTFWSELRQSLDQFNSARFQEGTGWQANILRAQPESLPLLARFYWNDISAGRMHFNGRLQRALVLEGTSLEGWQYFMRQWLLEGTARQLTVYEIGQDWREEYAQNRRLPAGSVAW